jgi:hypothetical protein
MIEAVIHPARLNQKHTQMMTDAGMMRVSLDQGAISRLRLGQSPGAVIGQGITQCIIKCAGKRRFAGW